jgi:hypothetical protein
MPQPCERVATRETLRSRTSLSRNASVSARADSERIEMRPDRIASRKGSRQRDRRKNQLSSLTSSGAVPCSSQIAISSSTNASQPAQ